MKKELFVYLGTEKSGVLTEVDGQKLYFQYCPGTTMPISYALPIKEGKYDTKLVRPFFENLLPEGEILNQVASIFRVSKNNPF